MNLDLEPARGIARDHADDRHTLQRKLSDRYAKDKGAVLWALHREGTLDCSVDNAYWRDLDDAEGQFTADDVAKLLLAASRRPDLAGLSSSWRSDVDGWNIYCRCLVDAVVAEPGPLVEAFRAIPEPMHTPFGLELVRHGALAASELPRAFERLGKTAVSEVGRQRVAEMLAAAFPDRVGPELARAAAAPGTAIWNLSFTAHTLAVSSPDQLARLALNLDYRDTVAEAIALLDRRPDGLEAAIVAALADGFPPADFGLATALGWMASRAAARGEVLATDLAERLLAANLSDLDEGWLDRVMPGLPLGLREAWAVGQLGGYRADLRPIASTCTERTADAAIAVVRDAGRGEFRSPGAAAAFRAIGARFPEKLAEALRDGKKVPQRLVWVQGLADAGAGPEALAAALHDSIEAVRTAAAAGLAAQGEPGRRLLEQAAASKKKDVREAAAAALAAGAGPTTDEDHLEARREALPQAAKDEFEGLWDEVRWGERSVDDAVAALCERHGDQALLLAYDGLYTQPGTTTAKLAGWRAVVDRAPVTADTATLCVRMVVGWRLGAEGFDDDPERHDHAIRTFYGYLTDRFGDLARPGVVAVLTEADGAGQDELWAYGLARGWPEVRALWEPLAGAASERFLALGLAALGAAALPALEARLGASVADVRRAAARALEGAALPEALPMLERALARERSAAVTGALARAAFACASGDADARMARYAGPAPKRWPADPPPLRWAGTGVALSAGAVAFVASRLGECKDPDPVWRWLRPALDAGDRAAWWRWLAAAFDGDDLAASGWVLYAAAILADDTAIRALGAELDARARGGRSAVAFHHLEVLARHGSPAALGWLDHWSRKAKSQALKARAADALAAAAATLGVSPDEVADRATPDFGFGPDGVRPFPYGGQVLGLRVGAHGTVELLDPSGATLADLPKGAGAAAAKKELAALKKELRPVLQAASERLEQRMVAGRTLTRDAFAATWGRHPLLSAIAREVVWESDGALVRLVDGALRTLDGAAWDGAGPIGVAHPLGWTDALRAQVEAAGLRPPFPQLARPRSAPTDAEAGLVALERFERDRFPTARLRATLEARGWVRGQPQDAGAVLWFTKGVRGGATAVLRLEPGFSISGWDSASEQHVSVIEFARGAFGRELPWRLDRIPLGQVDPIAFAEVVGDVEAAG